MRKEKGKSRKEEFVQYQGTWAVRKKAAKLFKDLGLSCKEGNKKEIFDVGEGLLRGILIPIREYSPAPIPVPPPMLHPSFGQVTEDLCQAFTKGRETFLSGGGVPWLECQLEVCCCTLEGKGLDL